MYFKYLHRDQKVKTFSRISMIPLAQSTSCIILHRITLYMYVLFVSGDPGINGTMGEPGYNGSKGEVTDMCYCIDT